MLWVNPSLDMLWVWVFMHMAFLVFHGAFERALWAWRMAMGSDCRGYTLQNGFSIQLKMKNLPKIMLLISC